MKGPTTSGLVSFLFFRFPFFFLFAAAVKRDVSWARNRMKLETLPGRGEDDVFGMTC